MLGVVWGSPEAAIDLVSRAARSRQIVDDKVGESWVDQKSILGFGGEDRVLRRWRSGLC